jgi:hypothetical protein
MRSGTYGSDMAEILSFAVSKPRAARRPSRRSGEVVIFPGIRVEYHDKAIDAASAAAQPQPNDRASSTQVQAPQTA